MYCFNCGALLVDDAAFCHKCGRPQGVHGRQEPVCRVICEINPLVTYRRRVNMSKCWTRC